MRRRERVAGFMFLLPTLIVLTTIVAIPLGYSLVVSLYAYTFINPHFSNFIGFENFESSFLDPYFWHSLWVSVKYVVLVVSIEFSIGFFIALMLNRNIKFKRVYYTILTIPMVMAPVAVGIIWKMLLNPDLGILNNMLNFLKIPPQNWLGASEAFWSVLFVDIWQQVSFMILVLLAGLVSLPKEPFEAAEIDGASEPQKFFYITIPMMKPVIYVAITIRTIFAFRTFDLVYVLTRGGPGVSTDVLSYYIYRQTFMGLNLGKAAATSYILMIVVMSFIILLFKVMRKGVAE